VADRLLHLLFVFYLARRGLTGSRHPDVRLMRQLRSAFYLNAWQRAAATAGAKFTKLSDATAEISKSGCQLRVSGTMTSLDDPVTLQLAGDKPAVHSLLAHRGIPIPRHVVINAPELKSLGDILHSLPTPVVIKPAANTGAGDGVSTNVTTVGQLRHAIAWAQAFDPRILIESQIDGDCYRVLLMDGEVLDVVMRRRPRVIGNGKSTVRQLIADENRLRLRIGIERAQALIRLDPDLTSTLASQQMCLRSTPLEGAAVELKQVINDNRADENEEANGCLCPPILETARRAAKAVGLRLAGVDVICSDPKVPLDRSGGVIIDVNATPGFYYHYHRVGVCFPVADYILQRIFSMSAQYAG
jgi:glutathione synthase/RimK-type ligase-like ATP-grasp enzyme